MVAPSVRDRLCALAGLTTAQEDPAEPDHRASERTGPEAVVPPDSPDSALAAMLDVLETPRDPLAVERAIDGLARHGAALREDAAVLSPLRKRARQVFDHPGESEIRLALAATLRALCEGITVLAIKEGENPDPDFQLVSRWHFSRTFLDRNADIIDLVFAGHALPCLSAPSDTTGCVTPSDLLARLADYRAAGAEPGRTDLNLALLRLSSAGRAQARKAFTPATEPERAVAYALGNDEAPGKDAALWICAWAARQPGKEDSRISSLLRKPLPDAGRPAAYTLDVVKKESGGYGWCVVDVVVDPPEARAPPGILPSLFYPPRPNRYFNETPCGNVYTDIAWASLVRPGWTEPFFRQALLAMETDQKLSDHFCRAYLEPLLRPGAVPGPLGIATLAYYLASTDKSVTALAEDVIGELVREQNLSAESFADALRPFLNCGVLPVARWTKAFAGIAALSAPHATFVQRTVAGLLVAPPDDVLRNFGGMLELLFELHVASKTPFDHPAAAACLNGIASGGKLGRFSKKLLALAP